MNNNTFVMLACSVIVTTRTMLHFTYQPRRKPNIAREIAILIFTVYISWTMSITMNLTGIIHGLFYFTWFKNGIPFWGMYNIFTKCDPLAITENILGNILLFVPFGVFLSLLLKSYRNLLYITSASFAFSLIIELTQGLTMRGGDIDDIILNTAGGIIGYYLFKYLHFRNRRLAQQFLSHNNMSHVQ